MFPAPPPAPPEREPLGNPGDYEELGKKVKGWCKLSADPPKLLHMHSSADDLISGYVLQTAVAT